jgi:hypothetical protein
MPQSVGFQPEKIAAESLSPMNVREDRSSSSVVPSNTVELVLGVSNLCGYELEEDNVGNLDLDSSQTENASVKGTVNKLEKVVRGAKSLGISASAVETTIAINKRIELGETSTESKVRSKSTERASLHSRTVGYVADEEMSEHFQDKFQVKTDKAIETKARTNMPERAEKVTLYEGYTPQEEETSEFKEASTKLEQIKVKSSKPNANQQVIKQTQSIGENTEEDVANNLISDRAKEERTTVSEIKKQHNERATLQDRAEGFEAKEEVPELFKDKFEVRTETATEGKTKNHITKTALKLPRDEGFYPKYQSGEDFANNEIKSDIARKSVIRSESTERASSLSRNFGFKPEEKGTRDILEIQTKPEKANQIRYRSESIERASVQSRSVGVRAEEEQVVEFAEVFKKKGENANQKNTEISTSKVSKEGTQLGFCPEQQEVEEIADYQIETETIRPQHSTTYLTGRALRTSKPLGISAHVESSDNLDDVKVSEQEASILIIEQMKDKAECVSLAAGFDTTEDKTEELSVEKTRPEEIKPQQEQQISRSKATRMSRKQGYLPIGQTPEEIPGYVLPTENASECKIRNQSNDRALSSAQRMGFEPLDLSTEHLSDQKINYGNASTENEKNGKAQAERISIHGGRVPQNIEAKEVIFPSEKTDRIKERVERGQSNERAVILSQTMGFIMDTEDASTFVESSKKVDNEKAALQMESLRGRATSKPRIQGFEPVVEDIKEVSSEGLLIGMAQQGENKVHRESRSRAVKKEKHTGLGHPVEEVESFQSVEKITEGARESIAKDDLNLANSMNIQSSFLPLEIHISSLEDVSQDINALSASGEIDEDAIPRDISESNDLKRDSEDLTSSFDKNKNIMRAKRVKGKENDQIVQNNENEIAEQNGNKKDSKKNLYKVEGKENEESVISEVNKKIKEPKEKKKVQKKPEIETDTDGTFAVKLKKSGTIKRQIDDVKLEKVQLKHHEFENTPQIPADEAPTNVLISKPQSIQYNDTDTAKTTKKKLIKKKIKKISEPIKTDSDSESIVSEPNIKEAESPKSMSDKATSDKKAEQIEPVTDSDYVAEPFECDGSDKPEEQEISLEEKTIPIKTKIKKPIVKPSPMHGTESSIDADEPKQQEISSTEKQISVKKKIKKQILGDRPIKGTEGEIDDDNVVVKTEEEPICTETALVSIEEKKSNIGDLKKIEVGIQSKHVKKSKVVEKKAEIETEGDGTFAIKLKKAETVKRKMEETTMEEVKLKHHEFEKVPQTPSEEATGNVTMGTPISIQTDKEDVTKNRKKTLKSKLKKPRELDGIDSDSQPTKTDEIDLKEKQQKTDKSIQEILVPDQKEMSVDHSDSPVDLYETDELSKTDQPSVVDNEKLTKLTNKRKKVEKGKVSKLDKEDKTDTKLNDLESKPFINEPVNVMADKECDKRATKTEKEVRFSPLTETADKKSLPKKEELVAPEIKTDEDGTFTIKLKKSETIKRPIEGAKLEEIDLKHHEFEFEPQTPEDELISQIRLTTPLSIQVEDSEDDIKKKKKIITKKKVKKPGKEKIEEPQMQSSNSESEDKEVFILEDAVIEPAHNPDDECITKPELVPNKPIQQNKSKKDRNVKNKEDKQEEGTFVKPKLKKSEPVKRDIKSPEIEKVRLKSHAFEMHPQDIPMEQKSNIRLHKPLQNLSDDKGEKKEKKIVKKKKKKEPNVKDSESTENERETTEENKISPPKPESVTEITQKAPIKANDISEVDIESPVEEIGEEFNESDAIIKENAIVLREKDQKRARKVSPQVGFRPQMGQEDVNIEEVERKERDPIAIPGAAVVKKHSDFDKVELPTFLNFPTDQGELVDLDETEEKYTKVDEIMPITSLVDEEETLGRADSKIEDTKVMKTIITKTVKKEENIPEEIISLPEDSTTTEPDETDKRSENKKITRRVTKKKVQKGIREPQAAQPKEIPINITREDAETKVGIIFT